VDESVSTQLFDLATSRRYQQYQDFRDLEIHRSPTNPGGYVVIGWCDFYFNRQGQWYKQAKKFLLEAPTPYQPTARFFPELKPEDTKNWTILDFLDYVKKQHPEPNAQLAWKDLTWKTPQLTIAMWGGGTFVVVGLIFPVIANLIAYGSPFAPKREKGIDLRKVKSTAKAPMPVSKEMSQEDRDQLAALEAQLEQNVAGMTVSAPAGDTGQHEQVQAGSLRTLSAGPLDVPKVPVQEEEEKEYRGQFYPVAHPVHRKKDSPHVS
jgi:hypothetical protein